MIKIGLFDEKKSFLENDNLGYVFQKNNFKIKFINGKLTIGKFKQNESEHNILKKMLMSIKRNWFNLKISNDEEFNTENKNIDIIFNNYNEKACNKVEARDDSTLIYYNIYDNINLECNISNDNVLCTFILRNNCNPEDINITFNGNSSIVLDENHAVRINLNEFYIIFNNPVYKNFTLNENDDINLTYILNSNNVYINEHKYLQTENIRNGNTRSIHNLNIYNQANYKDVHYVGQRNLTIPISKSKFSYPQSYTTDLMYSISVSIIEDLLLDRTNEIVKSDISLCGVNYPSVKAFISRNIDHITPIVSFSVVLYKNPYSNVFDLNDLNPFDGVLGMQKIILLVVNLHYVMLTIIIKNIIQWIILLYQ